MLYRQQRVQAVEIVFIWLQYGKCTKYNNTSVEIMERDSMLSPLFKVTGNLRITSAVNIESFIQTVTPVKMGTQY